ncbi:hypothetical protein [Polaromonas sp.]|uniref:hypothetical protein n=1 Tax=Polaromonas sp. TaxID=1869339 RepID=UPI00286A6383|nr:hypothetical protein [Polaromonas sp.]
MADNTLNHGFETQAEIESAMHISVLLSWIERARELSDTFDHLIQYDEKFKKRCKENNWFPVPWEESESRALVELVGIQEGCIRKVIACNETQALLARA